MLTQEKSLPQAPQVWDKPTPEAQVGDIIRIPFVPVMQVVDRDIKKDGRVWLLVRPTTGSNTEEWVLPQKPSHETQQPAPELEQEPVAAGDEVRSSLQPTVEAQKEFEIGRHHGQQDAAERLHPIYTQVTCFYSSGYLEGYNSVLNPPQQPVPIKQKQWSVAYDPKWEWYQAWVDDRLVGHGTTHQEAEQIAQKYIATDEMIRRQNAAVLAAYAG